MKKLLLTFTVLGALLLGACEKEELSAPADKTLIKSDKGILCRGCGQWDKDGPQTESTTFRTSLNTDTIALPVKTVKQGKINR